MTVLKKKKNDTTAKNYDTKYSGLRPKALEMNVEMNTCSGIPSQVRPMGHEPKEL